MKDQPTVTLYEDNLKQIRFHKQKLGKAERDQKGVWGIRRGMGWGRKAYKESSQKDTLVWGDFSRKGTQRFWKEKRRELKTRINKTEFNQEI